ncbi:MAG: protein phosphatase 2C domain-containing protein [Chitinophagaceae bacterium]|nr:MAG: protein phosphatase 2C domain-containing protein [Chitinophagaceae bacterium]
MARWKKEDRIADIVQQPVRIVNGTVGKPYEALLDFEKLDWKDIAAFHFKGLEGLGLSFDREQRQITGTPTQSGDHQLVFCFKLEGQSDEAPFNEKSIPLIINPDPRSLWKNLESNREDPYWKEDNVTLFTPMAGRDLLVSSKRGRSHANVGSFREDDFAFAELENGWSLIAVSDGAGSAKLSRKGSAIACSETVAYFKEEEAAQGLLGMDSLLQQYTAGGDAEAQKGLNRFVYSNLGKAAYHVHKKLHAFAKEANLTMKDLSATLVFTLFKKYEGGWVFLSFGVGDCPMAVLDKELSEVVLLNWLDVGEFSGGTRFITMPEIFQAEKFATRFSFNVLPDFGYLVLMSDGIYDPKFSVEANLDNIQKWQAFFADLQGTNEESAGVELSADNKEIEQQLSQWMDFWSPGNHDDRTLVVLF